MTAAVPTRPGTYVPPKPIDVKNASAAGACILLQGPSGGGKTHFAASMPQPIVVGVTESNLAVYLGRIQEGAAITLYPLKSWADYQWFVRSTKNREWDAATVVLDSYTLVGDFVQAQVKSQPGAVNKEGQLTWSKWDTVKGYQFTEILDLLSAAVPAEGQRSYHIVVTVHEQDEAIRNADGEVTGLSGVSPAVPGGFRKNFSAKFDAVLYCVAQPITEKSPQGILSRTGTRHVVWTVPPDSLRAIKETLGGTGGRKVLPPTVENTWPALCAGWGTLEG